MRGGSFKLAAVTLSVIVAPAAAHEPPVASASVWPVRCDYSVDIRQVLANGTKPSNVFQKEGVPYVFDFDALTVARNDRTYPILVAGDTVDFRIGKVDYSFDRQTLKLTGVSKTSSLSGDSIVTIDGHCIK